MPTFLFRVDGAFDLGTRGVVLGVLGVEVESLKEGDPIELRRPDGTVLMTSIVRFERACSPLPRLYTAFSLPREIRKTDVPPGTEVWTVSDDVRVTRAS